LGPKNAFRAKVVKFVTHKYFEYAILIAIVANSLSLAAYDHFAKKSSTNKIIEGMGYTFTCIFTIEAISKIIAMGMFSYKVSYLRDPWNVFDFAIVLAGLIELAMAAHPE